MGGSRLAWRRLVVSKFKLPWAAADDDATAGTGLAPLLARDMALMFGQIGVVSLRASVVDMESMAFQPAWTITERGEIGEDPLNRGLDSAFPAAMATIAQMGVSSPEHTVVRKLSPRHWAFAWRIDEQHVAVAEARYRDQRDMQTEADTALVRLICDNGIHANQAGAVDGSGRGSAMPAGTLDGRPLMLWPAIDRRRAKQVAAVGPLSVFLVVLSALLALWMVAVALPWARSDSGALQTELARLHDRGNGAMLQNLAATLATGDYGEVQAALTSFAALGYFQGAVVTNARQRIVSVAGTVSDARIGDAVSPTLARSARVLDLSIGSERYGQLLTLGAAPPTEPTGGLHMLLVSALLVSGSTALAALLLLWRQRRR